MDLDGSPKSRHFEEFDNRGDFSIHCAPVTAKAAKVQAKKSEEWSLEWLAPLGLLGLVLALALRFVGGRPFGVDNDRSAQLVEIGLAIAAFAIIAWGYWLYRKKRGGEHQVMRDRLLVAIGFSAFLGYFNFGHLHFHNFVHVWDTYHYYMGAKYFPELGYERLYDCAMVADSESGRREEVLRRTITDLRTNIIVKTNDLLAHPEERCKSAFTAARWDQFKRDVSLAVVHLLTRRGLLHHGQPSHGVRVAPDVMTRRPRLWS